LATPVFRFLSSTRGYDCFDLIGLFVSWLQPLLIFASTYIGLSAVDFNSELEQ